MDSERAPLEIELEPRTPLRGVVRVGDEPPRPFEGWVELAAVIESSLRTQQCAAAA